MGEERRNRENVWMLLLSVSFPVLILGCQHQEAKEAPMVQRASSVTGADEGAGRQVSSAFCLADRYMSFLFPDEKGRLLESIRENGFQATRK